MSSVIKKNLSSSHTDDSKPECVHCGDPCGVGSLRDKELYFCCNGCRAVYYLLNDHNLDDYYSIEDKPGLKPNQLGAQDRFSYLDQESIRDKMLDYNDGKVARISFSVPQIHCSSCIWLLENLYKINESVLSSRVDFQRRLLSVTFSIKDLSLKNLVLLLTSIGYEPEIRSSSLDKKPKDTSHRTLYARLAVAGFSFGNIMLLSFPEYLGFESSVAEANSYAFAWAKILLALPVVAYSAASFFRPAIKSIQQKHINMDVPVSIGIIILFTRSLYEIIILNQAGYMDSLCALVFLLLIGRLYQSKTYFSMIFSRDYRSFLPISVMVKNKTKTSSMPIDELEEGNRILIRNQEVIPADSILIAGEGKIDYSFVTGESVPVSVNSGEKIYAGGRQIGLSIELDVIKKPSRSYLMELWEQTSKVVEKQQSISTLTNRISAYFTPAILGLALLTALFWLISDPSKALNSATAVLIIACPCALALASPFTLGTAQRIMGRANLFLRDSKVVENMARLTSVVFDKTGTITQSGASEPVFIGTELTSEQKSMIYSMVRQSTHPLSILLSDMLAGSDIILLKNFNEQKGQGLEAEIDGRQVRVGSYHWAGAEGNAILDSTSVFISIDDDILGYYRIANLFRKGLPEVITSIISDYSTALLSGDNDSEKKRLSVIFGSEKNLFFNKVPYDKLSYVSSKIDAGEKVGMIGDGLNDAGALKAATVGITIAEKGSTFSPACDGILMAPSFRLLPQFLKFSKDCIRIIIISFAISFLYNAIGLAFAIQGTLSPVIAAVLMPASSVTVVLFTTLATAVMAKKRGLL
ncbi:MAG: heavy metal translocating P-type ATPase metal-binding domain-containing protein [candidate division Zixibacteria bacterium]|nr:heavy metal translocating P-type ATPase metal-binding domain-containing protein [candidate division Zixibacteria bacterium]